MTMWWKAQQDRIDNAMRTIDEFERNSPVPAFPRMTKASVANGMRERVLDPTKLDQNQASLCGPAVFFYCLLRCQPDWFCRYVCDLYNDGYGRVHHLEVKASEGCRAFGSDPSQIADVDWIALASLRDSENTVLQYSSPSDTASGITLPGTLASWFRDGGFNNVVNETNLVFSKGLPTLMQASKNMLFGHYVCLFINDNLLSRTKYDDATYHANHWVVLEAPPSKFEDDDIRFSVYTYGSVRSVPAAGTMSRDDLSGNFYGYVSGVPDYGGALAGPA
jgi:hypothetical protein